jgi:hypothetical protein
VYANLPPGTLILSEQWDDALPSTMVVDGRSRFRGEYENQELTWLTGSGRLDNEAKLRQNLTLLAEADYLTIMSNRVYGVTPRLPQRYPLSGQYHQLLFDGQLGYEPVAIFGRFPHLGSVHLVPDHFGWPGLTPPTAVTDYLRPASRPAPGPRRRKLHRLRPAVDHHLPQSGNADGGGDDGLFEIERERET